VFLLGQRKVPNTTGIQEAVDHAFKTANASSLQLPASSKTKKSARFFWFYFHILYLIPDLKLKSDPHSDLIDISDEQLQKELNESRLFCLTRIPS